jgi:HME family heavy-metal exporter
MRACGQSRRIVGIQKQPAADTISLTRAIEAQLETIQRTLPQGVTANKVQFRQASFIETSIGNVERVLVEAAVVVAVILLLFLMNVRATAISAASRFCADDCRCSAFGLSINTMTLGGLAIAIGELVDDAVVGVENILRRLKENREKPAPLPVLDVIARASHEVRSGIFYATIIIILVFVPLFALSGIEDRLFVPLGVAYIVSILASLVTSITLTPVLAYYLPSAPRGHGHGDSLVPSQGRPALRWAFAHQKTLFSIVVLGVLGAVLGATLLPRAFLPPFNEGTILVNLQYNPGISLAESSRLAAIAERLILDIPEVKSVGRRTGRAELDEHAEGVHNSEVDVDLARSERTKEEVYQHIRARLAVLPVSVSIGQPIAHRLEHMLSGVQAQIALKIFGEDLDTLRSQAEALRARLEPIPGVVDLRVEKQVLIPQLKVTPDYERVALYGITPAVLTEALEALSNGRVVSQIVEGNRRFDVVMRVADAQRSTTGLKDMLVSTPKGFVPLRLLAKVEEGEGPYQILRENGQRRIVISPTATVGATWRPSSRHAAHRRYSSSSTWCGCADVPNTEKPRRHRHPVAGVGRPHLHGPVSALPVGGACRHHSHQYPARPHRQRHRAVAGRAAVVGGVDDRLHHLAGIAARNGILKISHYINLALFEGESFGPALVTRGSLERLSPVLMTALCAGLALVPLLFGAGEPGREILHPVAVTIFGGLVSSTLLDTLLTPVLFLRFGAGPLARILSARESAPAAAEPRTAGVF